jgi:ATP-binding cassette subfamily C protein PrsD
VLFMRAGRAEAFGPRDEILAQMARNNDALKKVVATPPAPAQA